MLAVFLFLGAAAASIISGLVLGILLAKEHVNNENAADPE